MRNHILVLSTGSSSIRFAVFAAGEPLQRTVRGMISGLGATATIQAGNDYGPLSGALPAEPQNRQPAAGIR